MALTKKQLALLASAGAAVEDMEIQAGPVVSDIAPLATTGGRVALSARKAPKAAPKAAPKVAVAAKAAPKASKGVQASHVAIVPTPEGARGTVVTRTVGKGNLSRPVRTEWARMSAWSFSRYKDWLECPLKARFKHIDRLKEPGSKAMERGSSLHKIAEDFTVKRISEKELVAKVAEFEVEYKKPTSILDFLDEFNGVRKLKPICEESWGFKSDWSETGWFGADVWCRIKLDMAVVLKNGVLRVVDHKSGRPAADHPDQLSLYSLSSFVKFPAVKKISSEIWYLDSGEQTVVEFGRDQLPALTEEWNDRVAPMMNDTKYQAKPNSKCQWCHYRKGNGGPCIW